MKTRPLRTYANEYASNAGAKLPHDRDEAAEHVHEDGLHAKNREPIAQARRDVESGILDTERIGTPSDLPTEAVRKRSI